MLKKIYPSIIKALLIIFNKSLNEGKFPDNMKISIVKPIYKGKCKSEIVNYRPISLLPVISKVLEKIVHIRVVNFLVKHRVIYEGQYGYRSKRSTTDAILDLTGNILDNIEKGQFTLAIFLDMSKAFDSISHSTLCKKLEYYGLRGNVKSWFVSYLKDRTIRVKYKNTLSDEHTVNYGTPQGSVLGPLMYILLSNDLPKCLKFSSCVTFADDTTVFISGNNLRFLYKKINEDLKSLSDWFNSNSLTLNVEKTKYILFRSKQKSVNTSGNIELNKKTIPQVKSIKFLGIVLDEFLDCNLQVKHILSRVAAGNYSLSMAKNILPIESKLLLYFSNVQSHLVYAISAWGPLLKKGDLKCIKKQQNKSLRLIYNLGRRTHLEPFYRKGNILDVEKLIKCSLLKISYRYMNNTLPLRITNLFNLTNHEYLTRNRNSLRPMQHTTHLYNKSFLGQSPNLWLSISRDLKNITNIVSFDKKLKKYLVNLH